MSHNNPRDWNNIPPAYTTGPPPYTTSEPLSYNEFNLLHTPMENPQLPRAHLQPSRNHVHYAHLRNDLESGLGTHIRLANEPLNGEQPNTKHTNDSDYSEQVRSYGHSDDRSKEQVWS